MTNKTDSLKAGLQPLLAKTLENALSHRIAKEFPRIGGPRICKLCTEMIMEVVNNHIRPRGIVKCCGWDFFRLNKRSTSRPISTFSSTQPPKPDSAKL
jgi:hypothetical protein